jgi:hypothetical protein
LEDAVSFISLMRRARLGSSSAIAVTIAAAVVLEVAAELLLLIIREVHGSSV